MPGKFVPKGGWRAKLEKKKEPQIIEITPDMEKRFGTGTMVIATPLDVDNLMKKIPEGKVVTQAQIRDKLAQDYNTNSACPITTGIFIRISAETAEEDRAKGEKQITPYWRVLKADGSLNEKFPGGIEKQSQILESEGHKIGEQKGKKPPKVLDYESKLFKY